MKSAKLSLFCLLVSLVLLLCGCGEKRTLTAGQICSEIRDSSADGIAYSQLKGADLENYFSFVQNDLEDFSVLIDQNDEHLNLIAAFLPKEGNREKILSGISQYLSASGASYRVLGETEFKKIQSRLIFEKDSYLILVILPSYEPVTRLLEEWKAVPVSLG